VSKARAAWRRLLFGLQTLSGLKRRGFFIPYRYAETLPAAGTVAPYAALEERFRAAEPEICAWLERLGGYAAELTAIGEKDAPPRPRWDQSWFPRLDGAMAYCMLREARPARVMEVGSGHSTRFLARARADGGLSCEITAIDPAPRADIASLDIKLLRMTLREAGLAPFEGLAAGDLLLVDSSHILMPGSDVDDLLGRILPSLPAGVIVAFHDIFLPDDYPREWAWRGYNEQQGLMGLLVEGWDLLFSSRYAVTRLAARVAASPAAGLPLPEGAYESGLWLRRR
jgi:predicted O-methyltransferase YrrM